ncbi:MAG: hypothetical protein H7Z38_19690 [Rubrivivax sp.]|nr:hypothetical protein [Pyrinomonadaceae bacterium]
MAALLSGGSNAGAAAPGQCRGTDRTVVKRIKFAPGRTTAVVKDTVRLCTAHQYKLKARAEQKMSLHLATGKRTSMTLYTPSGDTLLDGDTDWEGELPETGDYYVHVGTDATARYTLEVTIR